MANPQILVIMRRAGGDRWETLEASELPGGVSDAKGNGQADDRLAIQAALDLASAAGGGIVRLEPGTYIVTRAGANSWCLSIPSNVQLTGSGPQATIIKMATADAAALGTTTWQIKLSGTNIIVDNLTIDGNKPNPGVTAYDPQLEHHPGFFVIDASHVLISNVEVYNCGGDGIQIHTNTNDITIRDSLFRNCNRHSSAISGGAGSLGTPATGISFYNSTFKWSAGQQLDAEPGGIDCLIHGCHYDNTGSANYCIAVGGLDSWPTKNWKIVGNEFIGTMYFAYSDGCTFAGNVVRCADARSCIFAYLRNNKLTISGNILRMTDSVDTFPSAIRFQGNDGGDLISSDVTIIGNVIDCTTAHGTCIGIRADAVSTIHVGGNVLLGPGTNTVGGCAVRARPNLSTDDMRSFTARNNLIRNWGQYGVSLLAGATRQLLSADISGNTFDQTTGGMTTAISFDDGGTVKVAKLAMMGNELVGGVTALCANYPTGVPVLVGGGRLAPGPAIWSCSGTPEGAITAPIGSLALRRDGGAATTLYVKETGTGNTGWVGK